MKKIKTNSKNVFKTYFLIANVILSIVAFSYLVSAAFVFDPLAQRDVDIVGSYSTNFPSTTLTPSQYPAGPISLFPQPGSIPTTTPFGTFPTSGAGAVTNPPVLIGGIQHQFNPATGLMEPVKTTPMGDMKALLTDPLIKGLFWVAVGAGIGALIGTLAGGKNGGFWGGVAGGLGAGAGYLISGLLTEWGKQTITGTQFLTSAGIGLGLGLTIFLLTYVKEKQIIVEFNCMPFQPPTKGYDCELCNSFKECSEYTCKSLGQACEIVNAGTKEQKCIWKNPKDVNSPIIYMTGVSDELIYSPDKNLRPDKTGVTISQKNGNCIKAFTPLEFSISTKDSGTGVGEPSQCKIDYNLTTQFDVMSYYIGGSSLFLYNHTEKLSLPGPDTLNQIAPELKNDGEYTLYIRCQDANGNFNVDPYSIRFCVEKGPDTTPPIIENTSILNGYPIQFNKSNLNLEVYTNEPSECRWSKTDTDYKNMEHNMSCSLNIWEMNINNYYTCKVNLTGIESRKDNVFYFRCKDKPGSEEKDRNVNTNSYKFVIIGTQPLNILEAGPRGKIRGATDVVPVTLTIRTDNGYKDGEAKCYYKTGNSTSYIQFLTTGTNEHSQRQDLTTGSYTYSFKCVDLGGNTAYNSTSFNVEVDKSGPIIARVYKESGQLKIKTTEEAECSYSNKDCNFEIADGIKMTTTDFTIHTTEWKINLNYYIRCKDKYNNQPNPNSCSIIVNPSIFAEGVTSSS